MTFHFLRLTILSVALAAFLAGCGNKDDKAPATQVAAKVGSEEISVHQINLALGQANTAGASPQNVQKLSRDILEKLIDQQLAVDQATEAKLHRSPEVVARIEAARRDILARAYLQQVAAGVAKPSTEESKKYFADNPALFAQRRIFNLQEIVIPAASLKPGVAEQLRALAAAGKPIEAAAALLKEQDIKFNGNAATRAAEQIPLASLTKVHALTDGQSLVLESADSLTLLRLASSQSAPVPEATALPRIEQFLTNQRANEAVAARLKQLRNETQIAYMGEFSAPTSAAATEPAPAATSAPAVQAAPAASIGTDASKLIEKGVAGLK